MIRTVACTHRPSRDSNRTEVLRDEDCQSPKPSPVQACNRFDCPPMWDARDWGQVEDRAQEVHQRKCLAKHILLMWPPWHLCVYVVLPELWWWIPKAAGPVQTAVGRWQHLGAAWHLLPFQESRKPSALCPARVPSSMGNNWLDPGRLFPKAPTYL